MKRLFFIAAISALAILSCTKTQNPPEEEERPVVGSDTITPEGGVYDLGAVKLEVPEGAVDNNVEVRVEYAAFAPSPDSFKDDNGVVVGLPGNALAKIEFGPDGVSFKKPVTVEFPAPPVTPAELSVLYFDEDAGAWQLQRDVTISGSKASFQISHFSTYVPCRVGLAQLSRFPSYVDAGISAGKSNEDIVSDFHSYLLNGEGRDVFNEPKFIRGLWYTPMSSLCSGAWAVHADGLDSEPDYDVIEGRGEPFPEDGSFYGEQTIISYLSSYDKEDVFRKVIQETTIEEKRETQMKLYYTLFSLYYRLAKPRLEASVSGKLEKKGDEATVTVTLDVPIPKTGEYAAWPDAELTVYSSDPSAVAVSENSITTDGEGKATFKITVLTDDASANVTINFHKEKPLWKYDNGTSQDDIVDVTKVIPVSLEGEEWEAEFEIELEHNFHTTVDNYLLAIDNQYDFPDASIKFRFGGKINLKVNHDKATNAEIFYNETGETMSAEEWADLGVDPDEERDYDKFSGTYSLTIDPSKDVTYNYADRTCQWHHHQEITDPEHGTLWTRDDYNNSSISYSFSWYRNNSRSDIPFRGSAESCEKMTPVPFISDRIDFSNLEWLYEQSLLVPRLHKNRSFSVQVDDSWEGHSSSTDGSGVTDSDGFLLVFGMYFSLKEGTHDLIFEDAAAAVSGALPEVYLAMFESDAPSPGDGAEDWITTTNETHNASGTITIRKLSGQEEGE